MIYLLYKYSLGSRNCTSCSPVETKEQGTVSNGGHRLRAQWAPRAWRLAKRPKRGRGSLHRHVH